MKVLVCGGAGYIGSHLVRELNKNSAYSIVVYDNLSTGHICTIPKGVDFVKGDIRDRAALDALFLKFKPDAVMHFCASIVVSESCTDPLTYYENNVSGTITLLQAMNHAKVKYFIFSSTAALFGDPERIPIGAQDRTHPLNPYGESKLMVEQILKWCDSAYGLKYVCLRYFNACGADASAEIGEDHATETHLIPLILQVPLGKREKIFIYGDDYETKDGTCIRDYVHVTDLASAHIKALEYMVKNNVSGQFNLGCGQGYSVKEIIESARRVTNHPIPSETRPRRDGDAATLIASSDDAEKLLGWKRQYQTVDDIVRSAWKFHQTHKDGLN